MTTTRIDRVPSKLPHAHLYLDDIEEISRILLDAYTTSSAYPPSQPKITYEIGDEFRLDSINDLRERGGSVSDFRIAVGPYGTNEVRWYRFSNPQIRLYGINEREQWASYGKVKAVFDARKLVIKNIASAIPDLLMPVLWGLVTVAALLFVHYLHGLARNFAFVTYVIFSGLNIYIWFQSSRVSLVRSHERSKMSAESRRRYVRDGFMIAFGALITALITHFVGQWLK